MKSDVKHALVFAHRTNIDRYRRLMKTHLTVNERQFIERRLDEEEQALMDIVQSAARLDCRIATLDEPLDAA